MTNISDSFNSIPQKSIDFHCKRSFFFLNRSYKTAIDIYNFKGTKKSLELFEKKPFQFSFSKWLWGDNHVAVSIKDKTEALFISVSALSSATGIERSFLQKINPEALAQLIHANKRFIQGRYGCPVNNVVRKVVAVTNKQKQLELVEAYNKLSSFITPQSNLSELISEEDLETLKEMRSVEGNLSLFQKINDNPAFKNLMIKLSSKFENKALAKIISNETLLTACLTLPLNTQDSLLKQLEKEVSSGMLQMLEREENNLECLEKLSQLTKGEVALPWKKLLKTPAFAAFFEKIASHVKSESYVYLLNNEDVRKLMREQSNIQNDHLVKQFNQNPSFTTHFLDKLIQWSKEGTREPFKPELSKDPKFDQKLGQLSAFLQKERLSIETSSQALLSFLCDPDMNLTALFSLLKVTKESKIKIKVRNLFHVLNAAAKPVKFAVLDPHFPELLKKDAINADMLLRALKKVDEQWESGTCHVKKKANKRYGFAIDEKKHFFIRTYRMGRGKFKKAAKAVSDLPNVIVLTFTTKDRNKASNGCNPKRELRTEEEILNLRLENVLPPFVSKTELYNKCLAVQAEMTGDGDSLVKGPPQQILYAVTDAVRALVALHATGRFHSDFKPGNFLFKGDPSSKETPIVGYLHDFGLVADIGSRQIGGSLAYIPPDWTGTAKTDAYAVGVSLISMLLNIYSFNAFTAFKDAESQQELDDFITNQFKKADLTKFSKEEKKIASDLIALAKKLLKLNVHDRLSCEDTLKELEKLKKKYPFPVKAA